MDRFSPVSTVQQADSGSDGYIGLTHLERQTFVERNVPAGTYRRIRHRHPRLTSGPAFGHA